MKNRIKLISYLSILLLMGCADNPAAESNADSDAILENSDVEIWTSFYATDGENKIQLFFDEDITVVVGQDSTHFPMVEGIYENDYTLFSSAIINEDARAYLEFKLFFESCEGVQGRKSTMDFNGLTYALCAQKKDLGS